MSRRGRYRKFRPDFEPEPWYTDGSGNESEPNENDPITYGSSVDENRVDEDDDIDVVEDDDIDVVEDDDIDVDVDGEDPGKFKKIYN